MKDKTTRQGPCAGCGDPVAPGSAKVEGLRLCPLCAQVPDEVLGLMVEEVRAASAKVRRFTAILRRTTARARELPEGESVSDLYREAVAEMRRTR